MDGTNISRISQPWPSTKPRPRKGLFAHLAEREGLKGIWRSEMRSIPALRHFQHLFGMGQGLFADFDAAKHPRNLVAT